MPGLCLLEFCLFEPFGLLMLFELFQVVGLCLFKLCLFESWLFKLCLFGSWLFELCLFGLWLFDLFGLPGLRLL